MANPQKEDGFTAIANAIMDRLCRIKLTDYESRVLHTLWRKTYGWNKKADVISISQWSDATGISTHHIPRTLQLLQSRKLIITTRLQPKVIQYQFQKDFDLWDKKSELAMILQEQLQDIEHPPVLPNEVLPNEVLPNEVLPNEVLPNEGIGSTQRGVQVLPNQVDTKAIYTKTILQKQDIYNIFAFWNEQKIYVHKSPNGSTSAINNALRTYTVDEIKQAIANFAEILHNPDKYWWDHKWTLKEFVQRGLEKFMDGNIARHNYARATKNDRKAVTQNVDIKWTG